MKSAVELLLRTSPESRPLAVPNPVRLLSLQRKRVSDSGGAEIVLAGAATL